MECKDVTERFYDYLKTGSINRNIVECKVVCDFNLKAIRTGINRNIVECKADAVRYTT